MKKPRGLPLGCSFEKLFEFPVKRHFANDKALSAASDPFPFHIFLRIRFFELEILFLELPLFSKPLIVIVGCETQLLFKTNHSLLHLIILYCIVFLLFISFLFRLDYTNFDLITFFYKIENRENMRKTHKRFVIRTTNMCVFFSISIPQSVECPTEQKKSLSLCFIGSLSLFVVLVYRFFMLYWIVVSICRTSCTSCTSLSFLYAIFYIKLKVEEPKSCPLYLKFISIFFFFLFFY